MLAVLIALPTFFEVPLALALLSAGAPAGAAVALLFAGPITGTLTYQACDDRMCFNPQSVPLTWTST